MSAQSPKKDWALVFLGFDWGLLGASGLGLGLGLDNNVGDYYRAPLLKKLNVPLKGKHPGRISLQLLTPRRGV